MIEKHFYPKNQPLTRSKNICKTFYLDQTTFLQLKSYEVCTCAYICILHLLFLIVVVKCYFNVKPQMRKDLLKLELVRNTQYKLLFTNKMFYHIPNCINGNKTTYDILTTMRI
ncbi:hypothetical protein DBV15_00020 [Temnothorax longispinosus]|uniref:Uncharacterized protein n=1 Tax=Temnothorax longispinosus TaxID=300112 RepID=A0A4S2KDT1_9HYME|nr:hypothetical protein DBV15_00020 [Temnothorax longispinosus]